MDNSINDEFIDSTEKLLFDALKTLAGGAEEYEKITAWMQDNPTIDEVLAFTVPHNCFSFLLHETRFGKVIRRYEKENNLEKRTLGDKVIDGIIEHGMWIRTVKQQEVDQAEYAFTIGNSTHTPPDPELITFYPGPKTCSYVLNQLSNQFNSEVLKPLLNDEVREVIGVLGEQGQIPLRVRLLTGTEREAVCKRWPTRVPLDEAYPLVFVDIPDTNGYYGWEEECCNDLKQVYPQEIARQLETFTQWLPLKTDIYPVSADACYVCFRADIEVVKKDYIDAGKELSMGTWLALEHIENWSNPNTWMVDDDEMIRISFDLLRSFSYLKGAKEWVLDKLDEREHDPHDIAFEWGLPRPDGEPALPELIEREFEEFFSSKDALLNEINWDVVSYVATQALKDCSNKQKVDERRVFCDLLDAESDK